MTWGPEFLARVAAIMGLSYVAGFVIVLAPSGLGVREFFLALFLTPELVRLCALDEDRARGSAVLAVLVLRLVWTAAELVIVGLLYPLRGSYQPSALSSQPSANEASGELHPPPPLNPVS